MHVPKWVHPFVRNIFISSLKSDILDIGRLCERVPRELNPLGF